MATCKNCGFPMTEIIGVYMEEPTTEEKKVCLNCLRKKVNLFEDNFQVIQTFIDAERLKQMPKPKLKKKKPKVRPVIKVAKKESEKVVESNENQPQS